MSRRRSAMPLVRSTGRKTAFSSYTYLLALLLTIIAVFTIVATALQARMRAVRDITAEETRLAAQQEVQRAVDTVFGAAAELGTELAGWGEVLQQLRNPQYYSYWREQRLVSARHYPSYVAGIELYDKNGKALAEVIGSALPNQRGDVARYAQRIGNRLYLVSFTAVPDPADGGKTLGYVGTLWQFVPAMLLLNHFAALDTSTLAALPGPDTRWPAERIVGMLRFRPQPNPAASKLEQVALNALVEFGTILGILLVLVYLGISRLLVRPLQQMAKRVSELSAAGADPLAAQARLADSRLLELNSLSDVLQRYHRDLAAASRDLDETHQELWNLAHVDALTGAHNRRAFDRDWRALLETPDDQLGSVAFLLFDCDFFKAINDTYGHTTGDRLVQMLARVLQQALRKGDRLYRIGGDEFAAVLIDADRDQAGQVAERCQQRIAAQAFHAIGIQEPVKVSIGVAVSDGTATEELNQLPRRADLAMYQAKRDRHHKIVHYDASMDQQSGSLVSTRALTATVEAAQGRGGLEMHYQPIVRAQTGQLLHYEALARIRDAQGLLHPGEIFPVVDQRALQVPFDLSVVQAVCDDVEANHLPKAVGVSINLSAHTLMLPDLIDRLGRLLPLAAQRSIIIEVTETDLITQIQHVTDNLSRLREHGVLIALDDFGSGYSSIRYLASMPVDMVKFDIDMIRDLEGEASRRAIVQSAARMVRDAGYELVAEGIENNAQRELTTAMGATHLQGYLFGRPERMPHPATVSNAC